MILIILFSKKCFMGHNHSLEKGSLAWRKHGDGNQYMKKKIEKERQISNVTNNISLDYCIPKDSLPNQNSLKIKSKYI